MRKRYCIMKSLLAILLIILLSSYSFAVSVSDNDGSAFITKAEFDSLKNTFQSQIDNYNSGIDNKIDSAIAAYLSGILIQTSKKLTVADSIVGYPLKFQMKNVLLDWSVWDSNGAKPYWSPGYDLFLWGRRSGSIFLVKKLYEYLKDSTHNDMQINMFYNGEWDTSKNMFKIKNMMTDVSASVQMSGCFYNYKANYANEQYVTFGFCLDQHSSSARTNVAANVKYTRKSKDTASSTWPERIKSSGYDNYLIEANGTSFSKLMAEPIWGWETNARLVITSSGTSNERYLDTFNTTAGNGYLEGSVITDKYKYNTVLNYQTGNNITLILNSSDSTNHKVEIPVAYNQKIYITNKNNFKKDLQSALINTAYYNGLVYNSDDGSINRTTWKFGNMISGGWTIEPQFSELKPSGTAHAVNKRSLMDTYKAYYEVTTPYTKLKKAQKMSDGILLTEVSEDADSANFVIDITSEDPSVGKFLLLSKYPISQFDKDAIYTPDLIEVSDLSTMAGKTPVYTLSEGENKVYMKGLKKNDLIYYKIIWDKNDDTYLQVNSEPTLRIETTK